MMRVGKFFCALACFAALTAFGQNAEVLERLDRLNVVWTEPGPSSYESMPLGNGDIALNVWAEPNGDVCFYIAKSDAWGEDVKGSDGLLKLGRVRLSLDPSPLKGGKGAFEQALKLRDGEITFRMGAKGRGADLRVWVDANNPAVNVDIVSDRPSKVKAGLENWRASPQGGNSADTVFPYENNRVSWVHRNSSKEPALDGLAFGAVMEGDGMKAESDTELVSRAPARNHRLSVYPLTMKARDAAEWQSDAFKNADRISKADYKKRVQAHKKWWEDFWLRSWIFVEGDQEADDITLGYNLQRFITACAGRGAYPIKFNGSLFTTDRPAYSPNNADRVKPPKTADYRKWGGQYWFQNTRPMYWARLMAGDFDMMKPLFDMYFAMMERNSADIREYYGHGGFYFAETTPFYGGLDNVAGPDSVENWTAHYFLPVIELGMMMLDYAEYTQDAEFLKNTAVPMLSAAVQFYMEHFGRDDKGRLYLYPCNSIEQFWKAKNPTPDIAGLKVVTSRLLALDNSILGPKDRALFKKCRDILPPIQEGVRNGLNVILPYAGEQNMKPRNSENPELYTVHPFKMYGIGRPDLQKALDTFAARRHRFYGCWAQDPVQAAMLGLSDTAREYVLACFRSREPEYKFPAFWRERNDYTPDQDNGGNGEYGLQNMLMQSVGRAIYLQPALPENWSAFFKLHAPGGTTVTARIKNGKVVELKTSPEKRRADVQDYSKVRRPPDAEAAPDNLSERDIKSVLDGVQAVPLVRTVKGGPNLLAPPENVKHRAEFAVDRNGGSKHMNSGQDADGFNPKGVNTGLVLALASPAKANAVRFTTAGDMPGRDPLRITIEGSNDPKAVDEGFSGWALLYDGSTGLENSLVRNVQGMTASFKNETAYKYYRVLVTRVRFGNADGVQYAEIDLGRL